MIPNRLWQGTIADAFVADADVLLTCSLLSEASFTRPRTLHIAFPFADAAQLPDMELAETIAGLLAHEIALNRVVGINCDAGRNRSGLMVGLVLRRLGFPVGQALVDYIRARHPEALTAPNEGGPFFAEYLARIPPS